MRSPRLVRLGIQEKDATGSDMAQRDRLFMLSVHATFKLSFCFSWPQNGAVHPHLCGILQTKKTRHF